jgi:D-alanyl-D-alanine carboxypeptidase/D-alanyl-D-alanine-endopeptidase (penicillin-binding protein 4)
MCRSVNNHAVVLAAAIWFFGGSACAQRASAAEAPAGFADIARLAEKFHEASKAAVGVHVIRLSDGATLAEYNAATPMSPASNQKLLTTAVALKRLGPDFQFTTSLVLGKVRNGSAGNDLLVYGDGDPTTGDPVIAKQRQKDVYAAFDRWAAAVKQAGITEVNDLVVHAGIFQGPRVHDDWPEDQLNRWYCAQIAGVAFNDNSFVIPQSRYIEVDNRVSVGKGVWNAAIDRSASKVRLTGSVAASSGEPYSVAGADPAEMFALTLAERLARAGVTIKGKIATVNDPADAAGPPKDAKLIATERTPLADALHRCNTNSLNMMAECVLRRSGVHDGQPADWKSAAEIATSVLIKDYDLEAEQFTVIDGSGMSRNNKVSPKAITTLLRAMADQPVFTKSLAVGGEDGSLQKRFKEAKYRGRVIGKTGSLNGVSALSGYALDAKGHPVYAFSVLVNGSTAGKSYSARFLEEQIGKLLVDRTVVKE